MPTPGILPRCWLGRLDFWPLGPAFDGLAQGCMVANLWAQADLKSQVEPTLKIRKPCYNLPRNPIVLIVQGPIY